METVQTLPHDSKESEYDEKGLNHSNSFIDEKTEGHNKVETAGGLLIDTDDIGQVFDSPRLIDLGEDGKERPIRECFYVPSSISA
jgi:hypothetical protein